MSTSKHKRTKAPTPLGVLEFSSALNGDDPILILKKLRQFVSVAGYERRLALSLSPTSSSSSAADDDGAIQVENLGQAGDVADVSGDDDDDDESFLSFDDEEDDDTNANESSIKRQKLNSGTGTSTSSSTSKKTPSWTLDKNNYQVPFVGTSVAKGATGSITPNVWPTGFLQVYQQHSPNGVELISNDYISAVPPNGIHKGLCKEESGFSMNDNGGGGGKRKEKGGSSVGGQTRGQIISMSLQSNYWMALSEWILGFVSKTKLKKELSWEEDDDSTMGETAGDIISSEKGDKCTIPPPIMTILMKQRLPECITAIHNYTHQHHQYVQQLQKEKHQQKKRHQQHQNQKNKKQSQKQQQQSKEDQQRMQEFQKQQDLKMDKRKAHLRKRQEREETLLLSALLNLNALCHLSNGTAREVLRKLSITSTVSAGNNGPVAKGVGNKGANNKFSPGGGGKPGTAGGTGDGTSWMIQLFQQKQDVMSTSHHESQVNCLRLICTLLETDDYSTLVRLTEVPAWLNKQGGKNKGGGAHYHGDKNFGLAYIALRYGILQLLDLIKITSKRLVDDEGEGDDVQNEDVDSYAKYTARMLRNIRELILPPPLMGDRGGDARKGFVLGTGATVSNMLLVLAF